MARLAMGDCTRSMQALGAPPEAAALLADPRPAWLWSADAGRLLWSNAAGAECLGENGWRSPESDALRRELRNAARLAGPDGTPARLRIDEAPGARPIACRVRRVAIADGEEAILVVADGGEAAGRKNAAATNGLRSPIPEWMRARLAVFPAAARKAQAPHTMSDGLQPLPDAAGLSPQERAAFDEIAATLGQARIGPPQPAANDDAAPAATAVPSPGRQPRQGEAVPSAFCGAGAPAGGEAALEPVPQTESRLSELSAILDIATDGVVILDHEGRIDSLNGSAEALFGVRHGEVAGRAFAELLAPDSRPVATRYFAQVKADGVAGLLNEGRELESSAGGGTMPLFVTVGRIGGEGEGRFCAVLRDLTQWKQAEAELVAARRKAEEASDQKSEFVARVSHEIRTPLNGIIGFADVILEERLGPLGNARYREYVRDIRTSGEHVLSLVNDLLDLAKIEAGKLELSFEPVQLNRIVHECVMLIQPAAGRARIILRTSLAGDLPDVRADHRSLRQVVLNILSNAVKFTGPGGQVIVSTSRADSGVVLSVRDTGEGMSEAELVWALEPFRQLATAPVGERTGTGLGLPLTKALVEANRARFSISSAKGEGTIVKVTYPAAAVVEGPL